jgi:hypothetical protein
MKNTLLRMRADWQSRGVTEEAVIKSFSQPDEAERISAIFQNWHILRNSDGTGELDIAIEEKNVKKIRAILKKAFPINQEFLDMASDRFSKLISKRD